MDNHFYLKPIVILFFLLRTASLLLMRWVRLLFYIESEYFGTSAVSEGYSALKRLAQTSS